MLQRTAAAQHSGSERAGGISAQLQRALDSQVFGSSLFVFHYNGTKAINDQMLTSTRMDYRTKNPPCQTH